MNWHKPSRSAVRQLATAKVRRSPQLYQHTQSPQQPPHKHTYAHRKNTHTCTHHTAVYFRRRAASIYRHLSALQPSITPAHPSITPPHTCRRAGINRSESESECLSGGQSASRGAEAEDGEIGSGRGGRGEAVQSESRRMTRVRLSGRARRRMTRRGRRSAGPRLGERACSRFNYSRIDENKSARLHIMKARGDNQKDAGRLQSSVSGAQTRCKWETCENAAGVGLGAITYKVSLLAEQNAQPSRLHITPLGDLFRG